MSEQALPRERLPKLPSSRWFKENRVLYMHNDVTGARCAVGIIGWTPEAITRLEGHLQTYHMTSHYRLFWLAATLALESCAGCLELPAAEPVIRIPLKIKRGALHPLYALGDQVLEMDPVWHKIIQLLRVQIDAGEA